MSVIVSGKTIVFTVEPENSDSDKLPFPSSKVILRFIIILLHVAIKNAFEPI